MVHRRLSAGQRRRLALAVALARDPRLLLLDEPHAGLDAEGREVLDDVVAAAPAEDRTVLLASHELELARALADREVVDHRRTGAARARRRRHRSRGRRERGPSRGASVNLWREVRLVAGKDLRIEGRTRVTAQQICRSA